MFPHVVGSSGNRVRSDLAKIANCLRLLHVSDTPPQPTISFIAVAEIAYRQSGGAARLAGRVVTLNLDGCYIELPNTLPIGCEVSIKIFAESESESESELELGGVRPRLLRGAGIVAVDIPFDGRYLFNLEHPPES